MRADFTEAVLELVALIPAGAVLAYGDVAELLGSGGPRQVGWVLSHHGAAVPWWRVLRASGEAPEGHEAAALDHYLDEGTPLRGNPGRASWRVDLALARWQPDASAFRRIDSLVAGLRAAVGKLSEPDDEVKA